MNRPWSRMPAEPTTPTQLRADAVDGGSVLRRPVDPELPPRLTPEDARDAVNKVVTELHAKGALDAGNGDVLDGWLDAVHPQWRGHATLSATQHAGVAPPGLGGHQAEAGGAPPRGAPRPGGGRGTPPPGPGGAEGAAPRGADAARAELEHPQRLAEAYEQALLPGDAPEQPDRRQRRPDLDRLDGLTATRWSRVGGIVLLLMVGAGDLVTFWMVLAGLL